MCLNELHQKGSGLSGEKEESQVTTHSRNTEERRAAKEGGQGKGIGRGSALNDNGGFLPQDSSPQGCKVTDYICCTSKNRSLQEQATHTVKTFYTKKNHQCTTG